MRSRARFRGKFQERTRRNKILGGKLKLAVEEQTCVTIPLVVGQGVEPVDSRTVGIASDARNGEITIGAQLRLGKNVAPLVFRSVFIS